jgi:ABC-type nitrate/sulfonate/bicarbonate transport system substrate-binding protein
MEALLKSWGAKVKWDWTSSEQIADSAISSGQAQVVLGSVGYYVPQVQSGLNIEAFGLHQPRNDYAFVTGRSITSISQLRGQSVGVLTGGGGDLSYVFAVQALQAGGLTASDVHIIKTGGQTARIAALASGLIQASIVGHESLYELKSQGVHNLFDITAKDPLLYSDAMWASPSWLKSNPKMAVAIDLAVLDTYKWFESKADAHAAITEGVADSQGATVSTTTQLYTALRSFDVYSPGSVLTAASLAYQEHFYESAGAWTKPYLPVTGWATTIYDAAALQAYNASSK